MSKLPKKDTTLGILTKIFPEEKSKDLKKLLDLKFKDEKLFSIEAKNFLYEIISMIRDIGYPATYDYLKEAVSSSGTRRQILDNSPQYRKIAEKNFMEKVNNLRKKEKIEGIYTCGKCGSKETVTSQKQVRAADEPATDFNTCLKCGNKWTGN